MAEIKLNLSEEEVEFLKNLRHELKSQDCGGTAKPCYFGVTDVVYEKGSWQNHNEWQVKRNGESFCEPNNMKDFWKKVKEVYGITPRDVLAADWGEPVEKVTDEFFEHHKMEFIDDIDDAVERLGYMGKKDLRVYYYNKRRIQVSDAIALTAKGCEEYIDKNSNRRHFEDAKTECFTGVYSKEFVWIMQILAKIEVE